MGLSSLSLQVAGLGLLDHVMHVGLVCPHIIFLPHTFLIDLLLENLSQLLMLCLDLIFLVDIGQLRLFILFDTLLNVFFLLL